MKALIIEGDQFNARVICNCVNKVPGIEQSILAQNGRDALALFSRDDFGLIVLDLVLPDTDGREILRELRQSFQIGVPVIILSGIRSDSVYQECISLGASGFLRKPFDTDALSREVENAIRNRAATAAVPAPGNATEQQPAGHAVSLDGRPILVAEDDEMQALFIKGLLEGEGAAVTVAENGEATLRALRDQTFELVVLDVKMPLKDGFEVLERMRKSPALKSVPVIMLTAMGSEEDIIRAYEAGVNDYILKPFSEMQLIARVKSLLIKQN